MNDLTTTPTSRTLDWSASTLFSSRGFAQLPRPLKKALVPSVVAMLGALNVGCAVTGSGLIEEESLEPKAYDAIALGDGFSGTIIVGDEYGLTVRADDNLMPYVRIRHSGGKLSVDLEEVNHRRSTLEAIFTLPELAYLEVRSGSRFDARELPLKDTFELEASGGSDVSLHAENAESPLTNLTLTSTGGSSCSVSLHAKETLIEVSGGGRTKVQGEGEDMSVYLEGGSALDAGQYEVEELSFRMSGGSDATVRVSESAAGRLSGGSNLGVYGDASVDADRSGGSSVERY